MPRMPRARHRHSAGRTRQRSGAEPRRRFRARSREGGAALVMVAVGIAALCTFAVLAIDLVIVMTAKTQLQNAADAAALAGVSGLLEGSTSLATDRAIRFASYNAAVRNTMEPVVITSADVTFPESDRIRVTTHRTAAKGDAVRTYFLRFLSLGRPNTQDVVAGAEAQVVNICVADCVKPWSIPDRWNDTNLNRQYDAGESYDPQTTGYKPPTDVGLQVVLKVGNPQDVIIPSIYFAVDFPPLGGSQNPLTGAANYRNWIATCAPYEIEPGDELQIETGNMVGPTRQGVQALVDQDPGAYWDSSTNTVKGSAFGTSPRIAIVPLFDPTMLLGYVPKPGGIACHPGHVHVTKLGAFFIEGVTSGGDVTGRFIQLTTQGDPCESGSASFLKGIALVR